MAILQMQRINIYALNKHCKDIIENLQSAGVVELEKVCMDDDAFYQQDTSSVSASYIRNASAVRNAADILESYIGYKKSALSLLKGKIPITRDEYKSRAEESFEVLQKANEIIRCSKEIAERNARITTLKSKIVSLLPWVSLDIGMNNGTSEYTAYFVGSFSKAVDYDFLIQKIAEFNNTIEYYDLEILSLDENQTCVFVVCTKRELSEIEAALGSLGFVMPSYKSDDVPLKSISMLQKEIDAVQNELSDYKKKIMSFAEIYDNLVFFYDYFNLKAEQYNQADNISYSNHTIVMTGYITKKDGKCIAKMLTDRFDAQVELEDVYGDDVPVVLSNNKFTEPLEGIVLSYSPPARKEIDPTGIMAVFYYLFFGLMFSDAGYGLVISIGCFSALRLFPYMDKGLNKYFRMFFWCGVSTFFWGLMFGSFFGDAVNVIFNNFFNTDAPIIPGITTPIWFDPTEGKGPTTLLMFSFLLGLIHLYSGLLIQGLNYIRQRKYVNALLNSFSWMLLVGGIVLMLLTTEMLSSMTGFMLPSIFKIGGLAAALFGALLILLGGMRKSTLFKGFLKGAYNLYGITSYLSDILSYSRLLALGLATGVVAQVFNQLGAMFGSGVFGVIGFSIVFVAGHTLNIGINALGAYVHTNRLQYVEFFGKFYRGDGREFKPFSANTKNFVVKEDL